MKNITKNSKMHSNLLKKMNQATVIYDNKKSPVVEVKKDKHQEKLQAKTHLISQGSTNKLFNYKADMAIQKNAQMLTKGIVINIPNAHGLLEKEEHQDDHINFFKRNISLVMVIILMFFFSSCARNTSFLSSSVVPAAKGSVKVNTDNNKNYVIQVQIKDLADVSRLQPPKDSYVVWMETEQGKTEKLGQLLSSKSFLSKQMTADLETVSSYKPVKVFVTAENGSSVQYPDRLVILTTENF